MKPKGVRKSSSKRKAVDDNAQLALANGEGGGAEHSASTVQGEWVEFMAGRAHGAADSLHLMVSERIEAVHASLRTLHVDSVLRRARPLLVGSLRYMRKHPLRSGAAVLLLGLAAALTRPAFAAR